MRILFVVHRVPYPPDKGDKIRSYHECRFLAERHEVWLACLADEPADVAHAETLGQMCHTVACEPIGRAAARWRALARLPRGEPMSVGYFFSRRLAETVNQWLAAEEFDVVLAFSSTMAQYVWPGRQPVRGPASGGRLPRVMDLVDVDSEKFRAYSCRGGPAPTKRPPVRWLYAAEARRLARYEAEIARSFDRVILVSEAERTVFEQVIGAAQQDFPTGPPLAVPNGVDVDYFQPGDEKPWPHTMVFAGAMDYSPNIDAATWLVHDLLPRVRSRLAASADAGARSAGRVRLRIVGSRPTHAVQRLGRVEGVEVVGTVPDIRPYVRTAAVSVAPMRIARGVQNKVLEAMAVGVPVVTTSAGLEGLACRAGEDLLVADDAEGLAEAIGRVLTDRGLARRLRERGRAYAVKNHAWEQSMTRLEAVLTEAAARAAGRPPGKSGPETGS